MNSKNFVIGVLSMTAAVLFVGLFVINMQPVPVMADGMTTAAGDYVLTVGGVNKPDEEYIYVLDTSAQKLVAYRLDAAKRQIELVQGIDLAQIQRPQDQTGQPPGTKQPSGGRRP
jgi:hypothetical protein